MTSRKRYMEFTGSAPSPASRPASRIIAPPLSLFSIHQREKATSFSRQRDLNSPTPSSLSASMSAVSSETRRILRELERRNSPVNAGKRMKLSICTDLSSPYRSHESEMSSPSSSTSTKPPLSSLITPYRAHILPRLATLNKSPYDRPTKQTVDVGVSVDLMSNDRTLLSIHKSASKVKTVGGGRNKFAAFDLDHDEPEILYDDERLSRVPPLSNVPAAGFLSSAAVSERRRSSTPGSPNPDTFAFSDPIILANPSPPLPSNRLDRQDDVFKPAAAAESVTRRFLDGHASVTETQTVLPLTSANAPPSSLGRFGFATTTVPPDEVALKSVNSTSYGSSVTAPSKTVSDAASVAVNGPSSTNAATKTPYFSNGGFNIGHSLTTGTLPSAQKLTEHFKPFEPLKPVIDETKWTCTTCYVKNDVRVKKCVACQADRPEAKPVKNVPAVIDAESHWYCSECFIKNAIDQTNCSACGMSKPGRPKTTANHTEKRTFGEFKLNAKANWSCTTCFVTNPNDRLRCVACNATKPGLDFEPISFGFQTAPKQSQSSTVGVQCITVSDSPTKEPVAFGVKAATSDKVIEPKLSEITTTTTAAAAPTGFQFGQRNDNKSETPFQLPSITISQPTLPAFSSVALPPMLGFKTNAPPTATSLSTDSSTIAAPPPKIFDFTTKTDISTKDTIASTVPPATAIPLAVTAAALSFQLPSTATTSAISTNPSFQFGGTSFTKPAPIDTALTSSKPATTQSSLTTTGLDTKADSSTVCTTASFGLPPTSTGFSFGLPTAETKSTASFQFGSSTVQPTATTLSDPKSAPASQFSTAQSTTSSTNASLFGSKTTTPFSFGAGTQPASGGPFGMTSTTPVTSTATLAASTFNFGSSAASSASQPPLIQCSTGPSTTSSGQVAAPSLTNFSFGSGASVFGLPCTTSAPTAAAPSTGFSFDLPAPPSNATQSSMAPGQPTFAFPTLTPSFALPAPSAAGFPAFGQPSAQPVNVFSIAPKTGSSVPTRRTLTAKRKGGRQ